mmetsp:Transcript_34750/g.87714  ORF Transcript_34750/g.87714 Transcript_34750/m.87714 type:complete len:205 (-) Transcript_34750:897-1511(-)
MSCPHGSAFGGPDHADATDLLALLLLWVVPLTRLAVVTRAHPHVVRASLDPRSHGVALAVEDDPHGLWVVHPASHAQSARARLVVVLADPTTRPHWQTIGAEPLLCAPLDPLRLVVITFWHQPTEKSYVSFTASSHVDLLDHLPLYRRQALPAIPQRPGRGGKDLRECPSGIQPRECCHHLQRLVHGETAFPNDLAGRKAFLQP